MTGGGNTEGPYRASRSVLILGDLHLDQWTSQDFDILDRIPPEVWASLDALIIAGNLSREAPTSWPPLLRRIAGQMPRGHIYILPGPRDYHGHVIDHEHEMAAAAETGGATFVQKSEITLMGVRFLICTLWTDFEVARDRDASVFAAWQSAREYYEVLRGAPVRERLHPRDTLAIHLDHKAWLEERLAAPFEGETIVVTHHAPVPGALGGPIRPIDAALASDLTDMIARYQPAAWAFGATRRPYRGRIGRTEIVNASLGDLLDMPLARVVDTMTAGLIHISPDGLPLLPPSWPRKISE